jgi:8-oxo-dGTP pyrophosphatase MutT (NUDIX family)
MKLNIYLIYENAMPTQGWLFSAPKGNLFPNLPYRPISCSGFPYFRVQKRDMKRTPILRLLAAYDTNDTVEKRMLDAMTCFIKKHPDCFERSLLEGHVTGSAWIIDPRGTHVLLIHHVKLNRWLQPGGHCDGDADVLAVAIREAWEETGLTVRPVRTAIFDVDNHLIPQRRDIPEHIHYDIRFLVTAEKGVEELPGNSEVNSIRWIKLEDVRQYNSEDSIMRMVGKTMAATPDR